jgi:hypothetical protein
MNVDGVDSHSESGEVMTNAPPDIADEANVYHKVKIYIYVKRKQVRHFHCTYFVILFLLHHCAILI